MASLMSVCENMNYRNFYDELNKEFLDAYGLSQYLDYGSI